MIDDSIFNEKLGRTGIQNNTTIFVFSYLFYIRAIYLSNGIALTRYVNFVHNNWDNYNSDNDIMSDIVNDDGLENELKDFN